MEETIDEDLFQVGAKQIFSQRLAVDFEQRHRTETIDLDALDVIHREHPDGAVIRHRARDE